MRKAEVLGMNDASIQDADEWVELHHDDNGFDVFNDCEQVFEMWSNIPREIGSTRGAEDPLEEILDDDGYGTGRYLPKEGYVVVPVSVMIHSGMYFSLGTVMCMNGDTPVRPGGRGWDTTPDACLLYTYRELWERMMGEGSWMTVRANPGSDEDRSRRPATEGEFEKEVERIAGYLVDELNLAEEGSVYGYTTHKRVHYRRVYDDGTEQDCWDVEDGDDSCWGFLTDKLDDIDFPRELPVYVDPHGDCRRFIGEEYSIPEFVVTKVYRDTGRRAFLKGYADWSDGSAWSSEWSSEWSFDLGDALFFPSWWKVQQVAQKVIPEGEYDVKANCVEKDKLAADKE